MTFWVDKRWTGKKKKKKRYFILQHPNFQIKIKDKSKTNLIHHWYSWKLKWGYVTHQFPGSFVTGFSKTRFSPNLFENLHIWQNKWVNMNTRLNLRHLWSPCLMQKSICPAVLGWQIRSPVSLHLAGITIYHHYRIWGMQLQPKPQHVRANTATVGVEEGDAMAKVYLLKSWGYAAVPVSPGSIRCPLGDGRAWTFSEHNYNSSWWDFWKMFCHLIHQGLIWFHWQSSWVIFFLFVPPPPTQMQIL